MRTGKILGIGAALSAGLIAAHAASASVVTGLEVESGASGVITFTQSSGAYGAGELYKTSSSGYGVGASTPTGDTALFTWTNLKVTDSNSGQSSLTFAISGLANPGNGVDAGAITFTATGTGFNYLGSNTLTASGATPYSGTSSSFDAVSQGGYASNTDTAFDSSGTSTGQSGASVPTGSGTATPATGTATATGLSGTGYSLTYQTTFSLFDSGVYGTPTAAGGTVSIGSPVNAVTLPGSGPLTIIGGLVMVGGLAIRRRMKA
jgi:hypothetical protein